MKKEHRPYLFNDFFASGKEESISPFLTESSKNWGKNLSLKSSLLSACLLALSFAASFFEESLSLFLLLGVFLLSGTPALIGTLNDLKKFEINIDLLMTLAAFLSIFIGNPMEGALLLVLFELSGSMEEAITKKTKAALMDLRDIAPKSAYLIDALGDVREQSIHEIETGSLILIKAGELVPLDGVVTQGSSLVSLVHLTGESAPLFKQLHDEVPAGSKNLDGALTLRVTKTSSESTLAQIMNLIKEAGDSKPALETLMDRFGKWYAPLIIIFTFLTAFFLPWFLEIGYLGKEGSYYRALTFLVTASPCALIIATPVAYLSAISSCARKGILLKGGSVLDRLASCRLIAFDKTGTLTTGKLTCEGVVTLIEKENSYPHSSVVGIAAGLEKYALHPISHALLDHAKKQQIVPHEIEEFQSKAGFGLAGIVSINQKKRSVYIGHPDYIEEKIPDAIESRWKEVKQELALLEHPSTLLLVGDALYLFHFKDEIRPQSDEALAGLRKRLHPVMITGDHSQSSYAVAKQLGIEECYTNMRPEGKLQLIEKLSQKGGLIMVGDGMNDAPALARSTVGISMGKVGSGAAIEASDIVLLQDHLFLLPWLIQKAGQTMQIVRQNLFFALGVILFGSGCALMGAIPLWLAVLLHEGGTVLVGLNGLRTLYEGRKLKE